jgi:hypothetical protein
MLWCIASWKISSEVAGNHRKKKFVGHNATPAVREPGNAVAGFVDGTAEGKKGSML